MRMANFNLTYLNSTVMDIYMKPENNWPVFEDDFDMSKLNFTWNVTEYGNGTDFMLIQIEWNDVFAISPLPI